jgi:hypothetical protein
MEPSCSPPPMAASDALGLLDQPGVAFADIREAARVLLGSQKQNVTAPMRSIQPAPSSADIDQHDGERAVRLLLQYAQRSSDKSAVQTAALAAFQALVDDPDDQRGAKTVRYILQLAKSSGHQLAVQIAALDAFAAIVTGDSSNQTAAGEEALGYLVHLIGSCDDNSSVQESALRAFAAVVARHADNKSAAGSKSVSELLRILEKSRTDGAVIPVQQAAADALYAVVANNPSGQSAAGAGGVACLLRLVDGLKELEQPLVIHAALDALKVVVVNHYDNQTSVGDGNQLDVVFQLALRSSHTGIACETLERIIAGHFPNQIKFYDIVRNHWDVLVGADSDLAPALHTLVRNTLHTFADGKKQSSLIQQLDDWCKDARLAKMSAASDDCPSADSASTKQFGGTCFVFAAVRSFNRRFTALSIFALVTAPLIPYTASVSLAFTLTTLVTGACGNLSEQCAGLFSARCSLKGQTVVTVRGRHARVNSGDLGFMAGKRILF